MNSKTKLLFSILIFITSIFSIGSCKKKHAATTKLYLNYFGITKGRYVIYDVKEIKHDVELNPKHDTTTYQLKTYIGKNITDNEGRTGYEFLRFKRNSSSENWTLIDNWSAFISNSKAELIEENQKIIKLVFAPTIDKQWNPNAYNTLDSTNYFYSNIHNSFSLQNITFDSTLTVSSEKFHSLIDYKIDIYKYATNIGLISKTYKNLTIANFDTLDVRKGNEIHYKCIGYGFE